MVIIAWSKHWYGRKRLILGEELIFYVIKKPQQFYVFVMNSQPHILCRLEILTYLDFVFSPIIELQVLYLQGEFIGVIGWWVDKINAVSRRNVGTWIVVGCQSSIRR